MQDEVKSYQYAGFWIRVWATMIDTLLICVITFPILIGIYGTEYFESEKFIEGSWDFLFSWVLPAIGTILFWIYKCATPGKMAVSTKIVDAKTGQTPSISQLIGRYFAYIVSFLPLGLGFVWVSWDKKKQSWHDKLAGTVVIRRINPKEEPVVFNN